MSLEDDEKGKDEKRIDGLITASELDGRPSDPVYVD
jgi:hypothetical protein